MTSPSPPSGPSERSARSLVGRRLGRYEVVYRLASGGMASVYVARVAGVAGFERLVAIKVLHPHLAHEMDFVSMFLDEARLAARIHHPNVVGTLDISDSDGEGYFMVMEYIEGDQLNGLLAQAARAETVIDTSVAVRLLLDVLAGLDAAHKLTDEHGTPLRLVHRDVSPQNILVGVDGIARITDFGVAKADARLTSTREGLIKGKMGYLAPEQITGGETDPRSDLFAMGVVVWEALCGRRLFRGDTNAAVIHKVLNEPVPYVSTLRPELAPFDAVVARSVARDPDARFQTAHEFAEALDRVGRTVGGAATARQVADVVMSLERTKLLERAAAVRQGIAGFGTRHDARMEVIAPTPSMSPGDEEPVTSVTVANRPSRNAASSSQPSQPSNPSAMVPLPLSDVRPVPSTPPTRRTHALTLAIGLALLAASLAFGALRLRPHVLHAGEPMVSRGESTHTASQGVPPVGGAPPDEAEPRLVLGDPPLAPDPRAALTPTIVVRVHVGRDGTVIERRIVHPRPDLGAFEQAALGAVGGYRFEPGRHRGEATDAWVNLPVSFTRATGAVLHVKGSDTIGSALGPALAHAFHQAHDGVRVAIEALGSATAFTGLFDGTADIGASSRPVNESELADARRLGISLQEYVIGYDGIAVIVHPTSAVRSLTMDQLAALYAGHTHDWHDVGGAPGLVRLVGRPSYSGTHTLFLERVVRHGNAHGTEAFAPGVEARERNEDIVQAVASDPLAIGYVPFGFVTTAVRPIALVATAGELPISATRETIADGTYPIARPLLLYTRGRPRGDVAGFVRFALSAEGHQLVALNGFVPADDSHDASLQPETEGAASGANETAPPESMRVVFAEGSRSIPEGARARLEEIAAVLARGTHRVLVTPNGATGGDAEGNRRLAVSRARAVGDFLRHHGAPVDLLDVQPVVMDHPVASNDTAEGRNLNQRVDVIVSHR